MMQHDTEVPCPVCKEGSIVAEVDSVATESPMNIPIGPGSRNYYRLTVTSFHCSNCQVLFRCPPGKPDMIGEIVAKVRERLNKGDD